MSKERELLERILVSGIFDSNLFEDWEQYIQELLAQPEHIVDVTDKVEPVAWRCNLLGNVITDKPADNNSYTPLYKSPPKRKTLSAETIAKLWGESYSGTTQMVRNFARAIEKAHGITGGE